FSLRTVPGAGGTWWEQMQLPGAAAADRLDVWFSPAYTAPLRLAIPTVVAIHDLSFVAHPEWFRFREGVRRRWFTAPAGSRAAAGVTLSQFRRRELMDRLNVPAAKIHVVPPGIGGGLGSGSLGLGAARVQGGTSRRSRAPRVLFVGS